MQRKLIRLLRQFVCFFSMVALIGLVSPRRANAEPGYEIRILPSTDYDYFKQQLLDSEPVGDGFYSELCDWTPGTSQLICDMYYWAPAGYILQAPVEDVTVNFGSNTYVSRIDGLWRRITPPDGVEANVTSCGNSGEPVAVISGYTDYDQSATIRGTTRIAGLPAVGACQTETVTALELWFKDFSSTEWQLADQLEVQLHASGSGTPVLLEVESEVPAGNWDVMFTVSAQYGPSCQFACLYMYDLRLFGSRCYVDLISDQCIE